MVETVFLWGKIFELDILIDLHVMRSPKYKNHIISASSVCVCVCVPVIRKTERQIKEEYKIWHSTFVS